MFSEIHEEAMWGLEAQIKEYQEKEDRLKDMANNWLQEAGNWRNNRGQRGRTKAGWEVLDNCGALLLMALDKPQDP